MHINEIHNKLKAGDQGEKWKNLIPVKSVHSNPNSLVLVYECTYGTRSLIFKANRYSKSSQSPKPESKPEVQFAKEEYEFHEKHLYQGEADTKWYFPKIYCMGEIEENKENGTYETAYLMEKGSCDIKKSFLDNNSKETNVRYCFEAARALQYLHRLGYVHRDVKPPNFVIMEAFEPTRHKFAKLIDFGLVHKYSQEEKTQSCERSVGFGTQGYQPPESVAENKITFPSKLSRCYDTWAFAIVLLEGIFGMETPTSNISNLYGFINDTPEIVETRLTRHFSIKHEDDKQLIKQISKCLVYKVESRATCMDDLVEALKNYLNYMSPDPIFPFYFETQLKLIRQRTKKIIEDIKPTDGTPVIYIVDGLYEQRCKILEITEFEGENLLAHFEWQRPEFVQVMEQPQVQNRSSISSTYWVVFEDWELQLQDQPNSSEVCAAILELYNKMCSLHKAGFTLGQRNFQKIPLVREGLVLTPKFLYQNCLKQLKQVREVEKDISLFSRLITKSKPPKSTMSAQDYLKKLLQQLKKETSPKLFFTKSIYSSTTDLQDLPQNLCEMLTSIRLEDAVNGPLHTELKELKQEKSLKSKIYEVKYKHNRRLLDARLCLYTDIESSSQQSSVIENSIKREVEMGKKLLRRYSHFLHYYDSGLLPANKAYILTEQYRHLNQICPRKKDDTKFHSCFKNDQPSKDQKNLWWCYRQFEDIFEQVVGYIQQTEHYGNQTKEINLTKQLIKERINAVRQNLKKLLVHEHCTHGFITPFSLVFIQPPGGSWKSAQIKLAGFGNILHASEGSHGNDTMGMKINVEMRNLHSYVLHYNSRKLKQSLQETINTTSSYNLAKDLLRVYYDFFSLSNNQFSVKYQNGDKSHQQGASRIINDKSKLFDFYRQWENLCEYAEYLLVNYEIKLSFDQKTKDQNERFKELENINQLVPAKHREMTNKIRQNIYRLSRYIFDVLNAKPDRQNGKPGVQQRDVQNFWCGVHAMMVKNRELKGKLSEKQSCNEEQELKLAKAVFDAVREHPAVRDANSFPNIEKLFRDLEGESKQQLKTNRTTREILEKLIEEKNL